MADFATDTALEGGGGDYRVALSRDWEAIASGSSCLFCRPNPRYEQELEQRQRWDAERRRSGR